MCLTAIRFTSSLNLTEDRTMKRIIFVIVIALSLSACGTLREFNKPEVGADGSREFRATAAIGRCGC